MWHDRVYWYLTETSHIQHGTVSLFLSVIEKPDEQTQKQFISSNVNAEHSVHKLCL